MNSSQKQTEPEWIVVGAGQLCDEALLALAELLVNEEQTTNGNRAQERHEPPDADRAARTGLSP